MWLASPLETMDFKPKPMCEQTLVITGASSGIGLVTAKAAAKRDARVVLAARNERDLARAVAEIREAGGRAIYHVCDVSDATQVNADPWRHDHQCRQRARRPRHPITRELLRNETRNQGVHGLASNGAGGRRRADLDLTAQTG
jgi:NAD(P)-dependent dehydrogenase (short-subunit alcohol dehydrogenase family)